MFIGYIEHKTNIRFENMDDFESYINKIDVDYDSEDVTFTVYVYKINKSHFKVVKKVLTVKVLIISKKLLNIMDKTVIFLRVEIVS